MNKLKMVALVLGALTCLAAFAAAQANLPPEARLQVLIAQTESAIANGDEARALGFLGQMNGISGAVRPASTYLLEARLAGRSQDYDRAMQALEGYFKVAQPNDPEYAAAAQLYAAAESLKEEAARKAEAERTSADQLAWLSVSSPASCAGLTQYLTGGTAGNFAETAIETGAALGCDFSGVRPVLAARAASMGRPVSDRLLRDAFTSGAGSGPEMVALPAGSFNMGSPSGETGRDSDEGPQRTVRIDYQFAVSRHEVTWAEWDACVSDGGCNDGPVVAAGGAEGWGRGSQPVINVSWEDAVAYASWLSRRTGETYRLLSEAEWEYAARAGSQARWSFGEDESRLGNFAWFSSNSGSRTQPVGGKTANGFGLYDMHGNVWEWVEDCYEAGYSEQPSDGSAFTKSSCSDRVFRGGSWYVTPRYLRSADRIRNTPGYRGDILGFRLARTLP
jgi:formylglycine-generating enzyme required for sulfatase activity